MTTCIKSAKEPRCTGTGVNEGGLKVGDGTVVLNQQADSSGHVQAFSSVNIASGRPTVVLADNQQVNPDNISQGYRGFWMLTGMT